MSSFLPNGLVLIDTGKPGQPDSGDSILTLAQKINSNLEVLLTEEDNLAGKGLRQINRKLEVVSDATEVVEVDLSSKGTIDLSELSNNSIIRPVNLQGNQTLELEGLEIIDIASSFWIAYTEEANLTLRLKGGVFLSPNLDPEMEGEITITTPFSLKTVKLDNLYWMVLHG